LGVRDRWLQTTCPSPLWMGGTLDSFMWGSYPANLRNVSGFTQVPFVPEIMHGRAPAVFLHQLSWKVAIWPILCWCIKKFYHDYQLTSVQIFLKNIYTKFKTNKISCSVTLIVIIIYVTLDFHAINVVHVYIIMRM
jgi:hypothetical protein